MIEHDRRTMTENDLALVADPLLCDPWSFVKDEDRYRIRQWGGDAFELRRRITDRQA